MRNYIKVAFLISGINFTVLIAPQMSFGHGNIAPQTVNTEGLETLEGKEWLSENPYRSPEDKNWQAAIEIGSSGYNQNCARCHGLQVVSGGLAPDLRYLPADADSDEWYLERIQNGMTQNGVTKMPAFAEILSQEAAWAIRTYIETRPDDGALDDYSDQLRKIRDQLLEISKKVKAGADPSEFSDITASIKQALIIIEPEILTGSSAIKADSIVSRSIPKLDNSKESYNNVAEILTIGLSATQ